MRLLRHQACHPGQTEAGPEAVDEIGEVGRLSASRVPGRLALVQSFGAEGGKTDDVEAVAGVEPFLADRLDALAEQPRHGFGIAQRPARPGVDMLDHAIDAKQADVEFSCALAVAGEHAAEIVGQGQDRRLDVVALDDALGKTPLGDEGRGFEARRDRFATLEQRVETAVDVGAETRDDRRARPQ